VISFCACAAIGAPMAAAIAAIASNLFRMINSFTLGSRAGPLFGTHSPANSSPAALFLEPCRFTRRNFPQYSRYPEPGDGKKRLLSWNPAGG